MMRLKGEAGASTEAESEEEKVTEKKSIVCVGGEKIYLPLY